MSSITNLPTDGSSRRSWLKKLGAVLGGGLLLGKSQAAAATPLGVTETAGLNSFLSEIMLVSFNFAPRGWAMCNGQLLAINQNQALFSLLGTTYGGDGRTTFALPDLRGRVLVSDGGNFSLGQRGGTQSHTLLASEMPPHVHGIKASTATGTTSLAGTAGPTAHHYVADNGGGLPQYGTVASVDAQLASSTASPVVNISSAIGGNQPHENRQPFLCLNYVICLQGIFPSQF